MRSIPPPRVVKPSVTAVRAMPMRRGLVLLGLALLAGASSLSLPSRGGLLALDPSHPSLAAQRCSLAMAAKRRKKKSGKRRDKAQDSSPLPTAAGSPPAALDAQGTATPVPEVPFPLLVPEDSPPPPMPPSAASTPKASSPYSRGLELPTTDVDVKVPEANLNLLSEIEESPAVKLPSFDDFKNMRGIATRSRP